MCLEFQPLKMMKKISIIVQNSLKLTALFLLLGCGHSALASGETDGKKNNNPKAKILEKQTFCLIKTDSLKNNSGSVLQKNDSIEHKKTKPNTGASYNILFQVIYRNSFSDIFEEAN